MSAANKNAAPLLTILKEGERPREELIEGEALLGRGEGCVIRLDDRAISRKHAVFRPVPGGVQVEKKSEFAPLVVNGAECSTAIVREGDVISIGPYLMRVTMPAPPAPVQRAPIAEPAPLAPIEFNTDSFVGADAPPPEAVAPPEQPFDLLSSGQDAALADAPVAVELGGARAEDGAITLEAPLESGEPAAMTDGPIEIDPVELSAMVDEDAKTRLTPQGKLAVRLVFQPGQANVTELELTRDEVSIGRGKICDVVLNDKKSSRKHAIIRRAGSSFAIKDLGSANGLLVNGIKVLEQELSDDDVITIGDVEFQFKAMSADYEARQVDFLPVPVDGAFDSDGESSIPGPMPIDMGIAAAAPSPAGAATLPGVAGLAGIAGPSDYKRMGLFDKLRNFKSLPPRQKAIIVFIFVGVGYFLFEEDTPPAPHKKAATQTAKKSGANAGTGQPASLSFAALSPEQRRFVEAQHTLAFDHYVNREYDKTLYEIRKIFALIPEYKDSREIERYAVEGKRKLEALEEEKRRKEEETLLRAKVQQLVDDTRAKMEARKYDQAKELLGEILAMDPDNSVVAGWQKEIEEYEESLRLKEQEHQVQGEINKRAGEILDEGIALRKSGRCHSAMAELAKIPDIGTSDQKVVRKAKAQIAACRRWINGRREPLLAEGKAAEGAGEFAKAYQAYLKATKVDPPHPTGHAGMARIRDVLHEKSKGMYTEAVLAESYSDFATAQRKFKEVLATAPEDDIYYERAQRKLSKYFGREEPQP